MEHPTPTNGIGLLEHPAFARYVKIHKKLVGPKTAEKLFLIYEDLVQEYNPRLLSAAGWAAAEAAIVGEGVIGNEIRHELIDAADASWTQALVNQREINQHRIINGSHSTNQEMLYKLQATRAFAPMMHGMIDRSVPKTLRSDCYDHVLDIATDNGLALLEADKIGNRGDWSAHIGIAHELNTILLTNRLLSSSLLAMPSTERSQTGDEYPTQTHDVQLLELNRGRVQGVTPFEVKSKAGKKFSDRYEAALINGKVHLFVNATNPPIEVLNMLNNERNGTANNDSMARLNHMTETIIHLMRHHKKSPSLARHCLKKMCNALPHQRTPLDTVKESPFSQGQHGNLLGV